MRCYFGNLPYAFAGYVEYWVILTKVGYKIDLVKSSLSGHADFLNFFYEKITDLGILFGIRLDLAFPNIWLFWHLGETTNYGGHPFGVCRNLIFHLITKKTNLQFSTHLVAVQPGLAYMHPIIIF